PRTRSRQDHRQAPVDQRGRGRGQPGRARHRRAGDGAGQARTLRADPGRSRHSWALHPFLCCRVEALPGRVHGDARSRPRRCGGVTAAMERFTARDGLVLAYYVDDFTNPWTPAPTVLLLHAAMGSARRYFGWVPTLARRYRVVRLDLRGHGASAV